MKLFILGMLFALTSCTHAPMNNGYHSGVAAQQAADAANQASMQAAQPPMHFFSP